MVGVLASFGGILLLFSVAAGIFLRSGLAQGGEAAPSTFKGDRIAASLIGIGLIATDVVIWADGPLISFLSTFGITVGLTVLYSLFLLVSRSR